VKTPSGGVGRWLPAIVVTIVAVAALYLLASLLLPHGGGVLDGRLLR
jgi:hypothetical protein